MTGKEIKHALECCIWAMDTHDCGDCPLLKKECIKGLPTLALDLINRQQAEIERWKEQNVRLNKECDNYIKFATFARAEAIKEYIDKLLINLEYDYHLYSQDLITLIKDTKKEMVGEE